MPITRNQKESIVSDLAEAFKKAPTVVFAQYSGLTVNAVEELRTALAEQDVRYHVVKKTLLNRAFADAGLADVDTKQLKGQIAVGFHLEDEVIAAKTMHTFAKDHEELVLAGGVFEGKMVDAAEMKQLALVPSKEELYAKLVGTIQNPISGFVNVLRGNLTGLLNVLNGRREVLGG